GGAGRGEGLRQALGEGRVQRGARGEAARRESRHARKPGRGGDGDHLVRWAGVRGAVRGAWNRLRKRVSDGELRKSAEIPVRRPQLRNTMMQASYRNPGVVDQP